MSIECRCEPCPVNIRKYGYPTCKEDTVFEGTQCGWHEQIRGKRRSIECNGKKYNRSEGPLSIFVSGGSENEPKFAIDNDGILLQFEEFELHKVAKLIGAKRQ